jgi:hypothetical protein
LLKNSSNLAVRAEPVEAWTDFFNSLLTVLEPRAVAQPCLARASEVRSCNTGQKPGLRQATSLSALVNSRVGSAAI